jgi:voltage-gated potassium channel
MLRLLMEWYRRLKLERHVESVKVIILFVALIVLGAVGYKLFEGAVDPELSWSDSIWWSIVTMTTVGYGDYFPTTAYGRYLVALPVMFVGIGILGYLLSVMATALIESRSKELKGMTDLRVESHVLLVNFQSEGRNLEIVKELRDDSKTRDLEIVLVDDLLDELPHELGKLGVRFVKGSPSRESVLRRACVDKARYAIVLASETDPERADDHTLAAVLTIESINPAIFTVAECVDPEREELLRRSGCDSVVCVAGLSSSFLVQEVCDPGMHAVVNELMSNRFGQQVYIVPVEQMRNWDFSELQAHLSEQRCLAMGVQRSDQALLNPGNDFKIEASDHVICMGPQRPAPIRI